LDQWGALDVIRSQKKEKRIKGVAHASLTLLEVVYIMALGEMEIVHQEHLKKWKKTGMLKALIPNLTKALRLPRREIQDQESIDLIGSQTNLINDKPQETEMLGSS
jgi:hypothetical protein